MGHGWTFQQGDDPKPTSKPTQKWFTDHRIKLLAWPSQSTDQNPKENLWDELRRRVHKQQPRNRKDLEGFCMEEWSQIQCHAFTTSSRIIREDLERRGKGRPHKILAEGVPIIVAFIFEKKICSLNFTLLQFLKDLEDERTFASRLAYFYYKLPIILAGTLHVHHGSVQIRQTF